MFDGQLHFELVKPAINDGGAKDSIDESFAKFHALNPDVLIRLTHLVEAIGRNGQRASIRDIFGHFRIERALKLIAPAGESWALDNNFTAPYAREILKRRPDLAAVIKIRSRKSEEI